MSEKNQEQLELLSGNRSASPNRETDSRPMTQEPNFDGRIARTRNSVLWAAYADALGFTSELVNEKHFKRRTKGAPLDRLMTWDKKMGRWGTQVQIPTGCWSDDTQLRLAVSRAIGNHGFDIDYFARIELPVWPSYALGGGRASKAAARNLGKGKVLWHANTFPEWFNAGGNGAAMRIQPHVWSASDLDGGYMRDVIADSVCTHGHPRAIVGACFHAAILAYCLRSGDVPDAEGCHAIAAEVDNAFSQMKDEYLESTWKLWEQETGQSFQEAWKITIGELQEAIDKATQNTMEADDTTATYRGISDRLGLTIRGQVGSGILTSVAAVALAAIAPSVHEGVVIAANALRTDTDTIATMVGALLGASSDEQPPEMPLDSEYLLKEASRLVDISRGRKVDSHLYPDLLSWKAPHAQADALVSDNGRLVVEGLGPAEDLDEPISWTHRKDFGWQWVQTDFGQTLLIKRRPELRPLADGNHFPSPEPASPSNRASDKRKAMPVDRGVDIDLAVEYAKQHITDDSKLGYTVRRLARRGTRDQYFFVISALWEDLNR